MDKIQKIHEVIEKRYEYWKEKELNSHSIESEIRMSECQHLLLMIDSVQEEPISEDIEDAAKHYLYSSILYDDVYVGNPTEKDCIEMFKAGAKWQKEQMMAKAVDGEIGYWNIRGLSVNVELPSTVEEGDKVKVIVVKED